MDALLVVMSQVSCSGKEQPMRVEAARWVLGRVYLSGKLYIAQTLKASCE